MQTEYLGAREPNYESHHFLLVRREVARLDAERVAAAVAQHVLRLGVPGHGVGVRLLEL